jgi:hypothetical protein
MIQYNRAGLWRAPALKKQPSGRDVPMLALLLILIIAIVLII